MTVLIPMPSPTVLALVESALGKVDLWGRRGLTMLSLDEIEAMALLLAVFAAPREAIAEINLTPVERSL